MTKMLFLVILITLAASQSCPGFFGGDLLQSGQYAIKNPNDQSSFSFTYTISLSFTPPNTGFQTTVTSSTIANYNPLPVWGYNYLISAQQSGPTQVTFELLMLSDSSWASVQLNYLFSGRTDISIGNFQADLSDFTTLSPGVYKVTSYIPDQLPEADYLLATFISGFAIYVQNYDLSINQNYFTKSTKEIGIVFHSSTSSILAISFSYIIYPQSHNIFTFDYSQNPRSGASYFVSGPNSFIGKKVSYEQWEIQNRNLVCSDRSVCQSSCILTQDCIADFGNVWEGRCIFCAPGIVFQRGICLSRRCGANQRYFPPRRVCVCNSGYERVGLDCVQKNRCGSNQVLVNGECICQPGFSLWQGLCRECPQGASSTVDRSTCVCSDNQLYKPITNECIPKCSNNQNWVNDRCVCIDKFILFGDSCRQCPSNSQANQQKTTCICDNPNQVYFYQSNTCRFCPSGQFPNPSKTDCQCPANTLRQDDSCVPNCGLNQIYRQSDSTCQCAFGFRDVGGICVQRCGINEQYDGQECKCDAGYARFNGPCRQCPVGTSTVNSDQTWCLCIQGNQIFNPSRLLCEPCPRNSSPNQGKDSCQCNQNYTPNNDGDCVRIATCPSGAAFDPQELKCQCTNPNQHLIGGTCRPCPSNEGWNGEKCVCITDYYRINGICQTCDPRSVYNGVDCICNLGYFGDRNSCSACHESCSRCSGPQASQCLSCSDISLVLQNGFCTQGGVCPIGTYLQETSGQCRQCLPYCKSCQNQLDCQQCALGFQVEQFQFGDQVLSSCNQICGDGRRFEADCDDGNTDNGDGCSSQCEVETGWTCIGGTTIKQDTCNQFIPSSTILINKGAVNTGNKVVQSVRATYLPQCIAENQCAECFKALDVRVVQSFVPVKVLVSFVPQSKYQFYIQYTFDGVFVTSAIRVSIRLNRDFFSCFSPDDFNQVLDVTIDPATLSLCNEQEQLTFEDLEQLNPAQSQTCSAAKK